MKDITATEIEERKRNLKYPKLLFDEDIENILETMLKVIEELELEHSKRL